MSISLREGVEKYIEWQRDHGAKFHSDAQRLRHFSTTMGDGIDCGAVCKEAIVTYLAGNGTLTRTRSGRYGAVAGFYRYAVSRGYATHSPLPSPDSEPRRPKSPRPYIYSREELQRMFGAIDGTRQRAIQFDGDTFRTLLVVLYGTGLRVGEALKLEIRDVDLLQSVLTIRDAKFYRSRLVPVGPQLSHILRNYAVQRAGRPMSKGEESTFLANLDGSAVPYMTVMNAFKNLLRAAGISEFKSTDPIPSAARTASHIRRTPRDELVPRRGGGTKTVARSVDLHGPRQTRRNAGLLVHDPGAASGGLTTLRTLRVWRAC